MTAPLRCLTCDSPEPRLHPATQAEGEVTHICPDPFHGSHDLDYIRVHYGVPAELGGRVRYTGGEKPEHGTIVGTSGPHLLVQFDGGVEALPCHPTWEIEYLTSGAAA